MAPSDNGSTGMGGLTGADSGLPEFEESSPSMGELIPVAELAPEPANRSAKKKRQPVTSL